MKKFIDLSALTIYCALIYLASSQSHVPIDPVFSHQDKLIHLLAYAVMGLLAWRGFRHLLSSENLLAFYSIGFCTLYGISDELHQAGVPGRQADFLDLVADVSGAVLFVVLTLKYRPAWARV